MKCNILCGGQAGQGPNVLANIIVEGLIKKGFYVFCSREYESRIRGGHNFNLITFSEKPIESNSSEIDILISIDENTEKIHTDKLKPNSIILKGALNNISYAGRVFRIFNLDINILDSYLKKLKNYEGNIKEAKKGYEDEKRKINLPEIGKSKMIYSMNGSESIAIGAINSEIEFYYGYPMTPSTGVLSELSQKQKTNKHITIELESEIAVINAAIGSALTGSKVMVGTSGGGFDLMTEALSLTGMAEVPMVIYLAQRPGPSTGLATLTAQSDLNAARHAGHGEFSRIIIAPGNAKEAIEKTSEIFYFTQKYKVPGIILSDKHLAESIYCFSEEPKIKKSEKSINWPERFNSYESDENKISTENSEIIKRAVQKRVEKGIEIAKEIEKFETFKIYGNKNSKNLILAWGSTKGAILDSIAELDCKFLQILYLEPLSTQVKLEIEKAKNVIVVENNATSQLSSLIAEKTGFFHRYPPADCRIVQ